MNNNNELIFISQKKLIDHVITNLNCCRYIYNKNIQVIYSDKKDFATTRDKSHYIKIWCWSVPIVTYLPLTIQYKYKNITIIFYHKNT